MLKAKVSRCHHTEKRRRGAEYKDGDNFFLKRTKAEQSLECHVRTSWRWNPQRFAPLAKSKDRQASIHSFIHSSFPM